MTTTDFFFCFRLEQMFDIRHPLAVLANRLQGTDIEASLVSVLARQARPAKRVISQDLLKFAELEFGAMKKVGSRSTALQSNLLLQKCNLCLPPGHQARQQPAAAKNLFAHLKKPPNGLNQIYCCLHLTRAAIKVSSGSADAAVACQRF